MGMTPFAGTALYGEPDEAEGIATIHRARELGVNFLDTADYYGEDVTNRLLAEALYPYPADLVICTKVGATRRPLQQI